MSFYLLTRKILYCTFWLTKVGMDDLSNKMFVFFLTVQEMDIVR